MQESKSGLKPVLGAFQLWGLAVGLVISGEYFGWSYGWGKAGTLGFLISTLIVSVLFITFIFSFTELTTAIPNAGGPFAYAQKAFGPVGACIAGFASLIEFLFAPPAIALAIGSYLNVRFPHLSIKMAAILCYLVFVTLNIVGVNICASIELVITILAIIELLIFMIITAPSFSFSHFVHHGWSGADHFSLSSINGILAALPFAIWFFLAIEGAALAAEEVKDVNRTIPIAYISGVCTLFVLALGVMLCAGGLGNWQELSNINDPLPMAMKKVVSENSGWLNMLVLLGVFGLIASFHGIIMGYSRQIFALAREGVFPQFLTKIHPKFKTPYVATIIGGIFGIIIILSDNFVQINGQPLSSNIVIMSVFGAVIMYITTMLSLFVLRKKEPNLKRPFKTPFYPFFPAIACILSVVILIDLIYFYKFLALLVVGIFLILGICARFCKNSQNNVNILKK